MSNREQTADRQDCGSDAAAYVLGALEPAEADSFSRHLDSCAVCRDEVESFRAVVDTLPLAAPPYRAPRLLKRRVMAEVQGGRRRPARRRWTLPRPALALGATAMAALVLVAVVAGSLSSSVDRTRLVHAGTSWARTSAVVRLSGGHGELVVQRMPAPPFGEVYEVWVSRPKRRPAPTNALFSPTASGAAEVDVPGNLRGASQVMVTPEPAGGSRAPTHPPVLVAQLS
ncbi:MAG: anti-sigma factor [Actinomycetota bacterium]|nr:anti-sigma factor [Actinomycetota bacterium]